MKKVILYGSAFLLTVFLCFSALVAAAYAPQGRIDDNIFASIDGLSYEGSFPVIGDQSRSALLDNFTDALILMETKAMVNDSLSTTLTNPLFFYGAQDPVSGLVEYAYMFQPTPTNFYTRYWMGFRAVLRWLMVFLNYFQIRRYVGIALFVLLFSLMNSISKRLGRGQSMAFALSVLLVRPQVICTSLQYSCCFLIAFSAMLAVPWLRRREKWKGLFFLELGMLTMYFDFYTTPLITFGLPMLYLCLLDVKEEKAISLKELLKALALWVTGYIGMWLSKLLLTELLTDQPAFTKAWESVAGRFGIAGYRGEDAQMYSPMKALLSVWETLLPDRAAVVLFWIFLAVLLAVVAWKQKHGELNLALAKRGAGILVLAVLPLLWFCITAQPTIMHAFFQYRGIVLLFWSVSAYLCMLLEPTPGGKC